ncbi:homoserine kinase [Lysobacter oculi]|uniref:Homoserine kinase n=1 Tax=Solilutibacter oculi TaxID=2698682 RepID=A0A344J8J1_9GAMM|nr:homoserine kinase [Lysobacter oculi]AXA85351.1 homoserine kinase [Lysobacter oculi]
MSPSSRQARARAPGSVGNIGVGFDLLGHAVDGIGDVATVRRIDTPEVRIVRIGGEGAGIDRIPLDSAGNTAGRALESLREALMLPFGFEVELDKGIALGSGLGGSASSAVAALVAANALLDAPLARESLYPHALEGEYVSTRSHQGDNVGPMLLGGVALATPSRLLRLHAPASLHAVVVHPARVLETRTARAVLAAPYPLADFVAQSTALALFLTGLARDDIEMIGEGLRDVLVEPRRAGLIPGFARVKQAALDHGALGASISGGGPSTFAWFASRAAAEAAAPAMRQGFLDAGLDATAYVSPVNAAAAHLL